MAHNPASSDPYQAVRDFVTALPTVKPGAPMPLHVLDATRRLLAIYAEKDPGYGGSWSRRGIEGAFHNVARKFDRVETAIRAGQQPRDDDLHDLATYALLLFAYRLSQHGDFKREE